MVFSFCLTHLHLKLARPVSGICRIYEIGKSNPFATGTFYLPGQPVHGVPGQVLFVAFAQQVAQQLLLADQRVGFPFLGVLLFGQVAEGAFVVVGVNLFEGFAHQLGRQPVPFQFHADLEAAPLFHPELAPGKRLGKPLLVEKVVLGQLVEDAFHLVVVFQAEGIQLFPDLLAGPFLVGAEAHGLGQGILRRIGFGRFGRHNDRLIGDDDYE